MKKAITLALASVFVAGAAQAAVISNSASYGPQRTDWVAPGQALSLQKFDPLLGTLTGITFNWRGNLDSSFTATSFDEPTLVDYQASGTMSFSFPVFGAAQLVFGPQSGQMALGTDDSKSVTINLLKTGSGSLLANLGDFIGSGSFNVQVVASSNSSMQANSGDVGTSIRTAASAYAEVVYDYRAATNNVPEPGSLGLLGLALAAAAAASRRRR